MRLQTTANHVQFFIPTTAGLLLPSNPLRKAIIISQPISVAEFTIGMRSDLVVGKGPINFFFDAINNLAYTWIETIDDEKWGTSICAEWYVVGTAAVGPLSMIEVVYLPGQGMEAF